MAAGTSDARRTTPRPRTCSSARFRRSSRRTRGCSAARSRSRRARIARARGELPLHVDGARSRTPSSSAGSRLISATVADHGFNASTFTARVIVSTGSDFVSAVTGAIGALKGPLHGGAPGPALDMVFEIGDASRAESVLRRKLESGERLMGFGHRDLQGARSARRRARGRRGADVRARAATCGSTSLRARSRRRRSAARGVQARPAAQDERRVLYGAAAAAASGSTPRSSRRRLRSAAWRAGRRTASSSARSAG